MSRIRADLPLVASAFIWGTAFIAQKNAASLWGRSSNIRLPQFWVWLSQAPQYRSWLSQVWGEAR